MFHQRSNNLQKILYLNPIAISAIIFLLIAGVAMQFSAGGGFEPWARQHLVRYLAYFIVMIMVALTPQQRIFRFAYLFYMVCIFLLLAVEVKGLSGGGAKRWLDVGFMVIQPAEFMKLGIIMALARYFHNIHPNNINAPMVILGAFIFAGLPIFMVIQQPNLGTASVILLIAVTIFFFAGIKYRYFIFSGLIFIGLILVAWKFVLHDYQRQRVETFLDPTKDPFGSGYNIIQSGIAIGSGQIFGKGFTKGSQGQLEFLPEKNTDFIFAMIAEEFGFVGSSIIILLFYLVIFYCIAVAYRSKNNFGRLIAAGSGGFFAWHVFINIAMVCGLIPVVGVPLPMISYGGSIGLAIMVSMGFVLNSHINADEKLARDSIKF